MPSKVNGSFLESIPKMGFGTVKESPYMVTMAPSCGNRTFWYRDEGTAFVSWIHSHLKSILKHEAILRTWNSTFLIIGPIVSSNVTVPKTSLLLLSYALTYWSVGTKSSMLRPKQLAIFKGHTFKALPSSIRTIGIILPLPLASTIICNGSLWCFPFFRQIFIRVGNSEFPTYRPNHGIQILRSCGCRDLDLIEKVYQILVMLVWGHEQTP